MKVTKVIGLQLPYWRRVEDELPTEDDGMVLIYTRVVNRGNHKRYIIVEGGVSVERLQYLRAEKWVPLRAIRHSMWHEENCPHEPGTLLLVRYAMDDCHELTDPVLHEKFTPMGNCYWLHPEEIQDGPYGHITRKQLFIKAVRLIRSLDRETLSKIIELAGDAVLYDEILALDLYHQMWNKKAKSHGLLVEAMIRKHRELTELKPAEIRKGLKELGL